MTDSKNVEVVLPESVTQRFAELLTMHTTTLPDTHRYRPTGEELDWFGDSNLEPLTIISVCVGITYLVSALFNVWNDVKHPFGYVLDTRAGQLKIKQLPGKQHTLIHIHDAGREVHNVANSAQGEALLKQLIESV